MKKILNILLTLALFLCCTAAALSKAQVAGLSAGTEFTCNGYALKIIGVKEEESETEGMNRISVSINGAEKALIFSDMTNIHDVKQDPRVFLVAKNGEAYAPAKCSGTLGESAPLDKLATAKLRMITLSFEVPEDIRYADLFLRADGVDIGRTDAVDSIPAELVGTWKGTGIPKNNGTRIELEFTVRADGTGEYTFIQGDYRESQPILISSRENRFSLNVVDNNTCEGTYAYEDGTLTLDITTTFASGRTYEYTARCTKAQ